MVTSSRHDRTGLFILAGPACLMQFLWYHYAVAEPAVWDVLVINYGGDKTTEKMIRYCENTGLFRDIKIARKPLMELPFASKASLFLQMTAYYVVGKSDVFAKKYLEHDVEYDMYDEVVVESDETVITGCAVKLSKGKRTVLLEDGTADYAAKKRWCGVRGLFDFGQVLGMLLSHMGYGTCVSGYELKEYRYCIRYSTLPDRLVYRNYRSIKALFDLPLKDGLAFSDVISQTFDIEPSRVMSGETRVVVFTAAFESAAQTVAMKKDGVYATVHDWLAAEFGCEAPILIKKHPRDEYDYCEWNDLNVSFVDPSVPGELLVPFCSGKEVVLMFASGLMLQLEQYGISYRVIYPETYVESASLEYSRYLTDLFGSSTVVL